MNESVVFNLIQLGAPKAWCFFPVISFSLSNMIPIEIFHMI